MKILVVDDNQMVLDCLMNSLRLHGFTIETLQDSSKALETYMVGEFDVVLSDYSMPEINGIDLLRLIRKYDLNAKVILMTGLEDENLMKEAYRSGACAFFFKPIDFSQLIDTLMKIDCSPSLK